jgi:hypothetical protein
MTTKSATLTTRGDPRRHHARSSSSSIAGVAGVAERRSKQVPRAHTDTLDRLFSAPLVPGAVRAPG